MSDSMAAPGSIGKALLDGDFAPVHNTSVFRDALESAGGWCNMVQASWVESDGSNGTNFLLGIELDVAPKDTESFRQQLVHLMVVIADCSLVASMVAANLFTAIQHQAVLDRKANGTRLSDAYFMHLQSCLSRFELDGLFSVTEQPLLRSTRFISSLNKLLQKDGMDDEDWPLSAGNLQANETPIPEGLETGSGSSLCLFGERLAASVLNVPSVGRALELKVAQLLHPKNSALITKYLNEVYSTGAAFTGATQSLQSYYLDSSLKDGKDSNAQRVVRRFNYLAVLKVCQLLAFQQCLDDLRTIIPLQQLPAVPATRFAYSDYVSMSKSAMILVDKFMANTNHPITKTWVYTEMGKDRLAAPSGTEASHALHFLNAQLKDKSSMYHMPEINSPQKYWNDWFQRVAALKTTYNNLNDMVVIPMLLSHLAVDDKRIIGWSEAMKEASSKNEQKTLEQFLAHIKGLVVPTGTLRRDAAKQLLAVTNQPYKVADCQTLGSKIRLLFRSLFPPSSEEVEPMSRLTAMKHVHLMLYKLKQARPQDSSIILVTAWVQFTGYQHFDMFVEFIDEKLHVSTAHTERLCTEYVDKVVNQLTVAHRMYIQMQSVMPRSQTGNALSNNSSNRSSNGSTGRFLHNVNAMNSNPNHSGDRNRSRSRTRSGTGSEGGHTPQGRGGGRFGAAGRSGSTGRGRSGGPGRGGGNPPSEYPNRPKYTGEEHFNRVMAGVNHAATVMGDKYAPGNLRKEMDPSLTKVANRLTAMRRIAEGNCLLCQMEGHRSSRCPHFQKASPEVQEKAKQMRKAYFDGYYQDS